MTKKRTLLVSSSCKHEWIYYPCQTCWSSVMFPQNPISFKAYKLPLSIKLRMTCAPAWLVLHGARCGRRTQLWFVPCLDWWKGQQTTRTFVGIWGNCAEGSLSVVIGAILSETIWGFRQCYIFRVWSKVLVPFVSCMLQLKASEGINYGYTLVWVYVACFGSEDLLNPTIEVARLWKPCRRNIVETLCKPCQHRSR